MGRQPDGNQSDNGKSPRVKTWRIDDMPIYEIMVPKREDWQKLRDKQKPTVPKGAAKVSIGDAIAAVHKSYSLATVDQNINDTTKLLGDLDKYMEAIKKKYPGFVADVTKVTKNTKIHLKTMEDIAAAKKVYPTLYNNANYLFIKLQKQEGAPKQIAPHLLKLKGAADAIGLIDDAWAKKGKEAGGWNNKSENLKVYSDKDITDLTAFFNKAEPLF
jgi:uncharacterized protein YqgV (UPF0045/DUF77 family)